MKKAKLIQVLKTLDKSELKYFEKYLTKLYGEHELAVALFQYLKPLYPAFDNDNKLDLDYITTKVFRLDKTKRISNEASKLLGWLEEFLILEKIKKDRDQYQAQKFMIDIYKERKLDQFYFKEIDKAKTFIKENRKDIGRALHLMELNHAYYYHPFTEKLINTEEALLEGFTAGSAFFEVMKLKYQCELQSRAQILQHNATPVEQDENMEIFKTWYQKLNLLYETAQKMIETKEYDYFLELKSNLFTSNHSLDSEDHFILLGYLINHAAYMIRNGRYIAYQDAFELYKYGIEKGLLAVGGYITEVRFHNIVHVACELKAFEWIENFLQTYRSLLLEQWSEPTIELAEARILFGKKEYEKALVIANKVKFKDQAFMSHAKLLEIRCYYELGDPYLDKIEYAIRNFDKQLQRNNNLSTNIIDGHRNFLTVLKMILGKVHSQEELMLELNTLKPLVVKSWLEEKIKSYMPIWSSSLPKTFIK